MLLIRNKTLKSILATLVGIVFLNLSFFMAELNALEFEKSNKSLYDSLVSAFTNICEEEKDAFSGEGTAENELDLKEIDLIFSFTENFNRIQFTILAKLYPSSNRHPNDGSSASIHQPPESLS